MDGYSESLFCAGREKQEICKNIKKKKHKAPKQKNKINV